MSLPRIHPETDLPAAFALASRALNSASDARNAMNRFSAAPFVSFGLPRFDFCFTIKLTHCCLFV